jgi:hypothetical protein
MPNEILTRCGYRCDLCLAYKENIQKEDRRQLLSDGWFQYFGFRIEPEDIYCDGCLEDGCQTVKLIDQGCPVRPCVKEKGLENCSQCDEFICEKLKNRIVDYEVIKAGYPSIPNKDYKQFILPYENGKRLTQIKEKKKEFQRMTNKNIQPNDEVMAKFIGSEESERWEVVLSYIRQNYKVIENLIYGGPNYGWAIQFKQNKSTTLFTLYPERKAFTLLLVYGKKELEGLEQNFARLTGETYSLVKNTPQFHDGKWIGLRVNGDTDLNDIYALLEFKKKPSKTK